MDEECQDGVCAMPSPARPAAGLTAETFHAALDGPAPVLVDFVTEGCGPCAILSLFLPKLEAEFAGRLRVLRVDGDGDGPALARLHGVQAYPTLLGFHRGVETARRQGFDLHDYPALRAWVAGFLAEATGIPAPTLPGEDAFAAAVTEAAEAHDAIVMPLLDAAIAAQEPHMPAHRAAWAALETAHKEGRITRAEVQQGRDDANRRLHEAIGPALPALRTAGEAAGDAFEQAVRQASARFIAAA